MNEREEQAADETRDAIRAFVLVATTLGVGVASFALFAGSSFGRTAAAVFIACVYLAAWFFALRRTVILRVIIAVIGFFTTLAVLTVPTDLGPRPASPLAWCRNNLRQIGMALAQYHQHYGTFPPAYVADKHGRPLVSWREAILPYLDESAVAKQFRAGEAWDSPVNQKVSRTPIVVLDCEADPQFVTTAGGTSYLAVVGPNAAWAGAKPRKLSEFKDPRHTILVVEVENSGVHWAEPRDLYVGQMATVINPKAGNGISSAHPGGANVLFADGHVEFLPDSTDPKALAAMLDIRGEPATENRP